MFFAKHIKDSYYFEPLRSHSFLLQADSFGCWPFVGIKMPSPQACLHKNNVVFKCHPLVSEDGLLQKSSCYTVNLPASHATYTWGVIALVRKSPT